MIPLLAQSAADFSPSAFKEFVAIVFYLAAFVAAVAVAWRTLAGKATATEIADQPIEVRAHAGTVTREELKQVHGRIERERREIDTAITTVRADAREHATRLDAKIDEQTASLNARIDLIPDRTIKLLNETRQLHKP